MSDRQDDKYEKHLAEFHLESDLEAMTPFRDETYEQQSQRSQHLASASLANRRGRQQPPSLAIQLARRNRGTSQDPRPRSYSVPSLQTLQQNQSIGSLLKQFGDEYNEVRSPVRKTALSESRRRRSSVDFASSESSWLSSFMDFSTSIFRRLSGADIVGPPPAPVAEGADDQEEEMGQR